ncbi:MAG: hypothetical protein LBP33_09485 [Candidatus Adiutrix sp.]|jgi:hypothetical protein|nr:hypothetical protein [Candidatus Adiutrix sp.]
MALDGKIGQISGKIIQVVAAGHPAVILTGAIKTGSGQWAPGTILARDEDSLLYPWDGTAGDPLCTIDDPAGTPVSVVNETAGGWPVGVATEAVDSATQVTANYLAHGIAVIENLKLADGSGPDEIQILRLAQAGIYGA